MNFYLQENTDKEFMDIDVDAIHLENAFNDPKHYAAMKKLKIKEKEVLFLSILENLSDYGIAKELNIPRECVISLKKSAINKFQNNLKKICDKEKSYMNNKNVRIIYKKIEPKFLNKYGYVNLNHRELNSKNDLIELASIFRNPIYETFRLIYMKGNRIVGHEAITSRTSNCVYVFPKSSNGKTNSHKGFYKMKDRMERLNADGYYMVHNHPSGNAKASRDDLKITEVFAEKVKGFKGHLIVNMESYAWISTNKYGIAEAENYIKIKKLNKTKEMSINRKSIYDVTINSREELVSLMHNIKNNPEYSTAILTDALGKVRMILDIPNRFLNMSVNQLKGYFKNQRNLNGCTRVFFATNDNDVYKKSVKHMECGTFTDAICYKEEKDKIYVYEKLDVKESDNMPNGINVEGKVLVIKEDLSDYEFEEKENEEVEKVKILYKKVGEESRVLEVENTLEAKQALVGGLIEVVSYDDVLLICNEEGKVLNMPPNLLFDYDYIAGDCFLIGDDYERGDFKSLTDKEIEKYKKELDARGFKWLKDKKEFEKGNPIKDKQRGERLYR